MGWQEVPWDQNNLVGNVSDMSPTCHKMSVLLVNFKKKHVFVGQPTLFLLSHMSKMCWLAHHGN